MSKLIWTFEPDGKIFYRRHDEDVDSNHYFGTASAATGHVFIHPDHPFPIARYIPLWGPQGLTAGLEQAAKEMPATYKAMHDKVREHSSKEVKTEVNPLMVMVFLLFFTPIFPQSTNNNQHSPKEEYVVVPKSILSPEQGRHVKQTFEENDYKNMLEFANGIVIIVTEMAKGFAQSVGDFAATSTGKFLISVGTVYVFKNELVLLMAFPLFWCIFFAIALYLYRVLFKKIKKKEIVAYRIDTTALKLFPRYNVEYESPDSDYRTMFYTYLIVGSIIETIITAFIVVNLVT